MGRHSVTDKKTETVIDKKRKNVVEKFFGLTEKVLKHIEWSMAANKVCTTCNIGKEGAHMPGKAKDKDGKCAFCHGTGKIPDVQQRNWATGEIADRIAPKPKSVEMTVDKTEEQKDLRKEAENLGDSDLDKQLDALGVKVYELKG